MIWAISLLTMELIPHCLTDSGNTSLVFLVCHDLVPLSQPAPKQCFTPKPYIFPESLRLNTFRGEPASSEFDWHFTPSHNSSHDFSTSMSSDLHLGSYPSFILVMTRSPGFGSIRNDINALIKLAFAMASFFILTTPLPISRRLILPQARGQSYNFSHCLLDYGFICFFTPLKGFFFTFPSRYLFAIGHLGVFSLTRWSSLIHTGFHVPHATWD